MGKPRRLFRWLASAVGVLALLVVAFLVFVTASWPPRFHDAPRPAFAAVEDPEVIARGAYLFWAAAHCGGCHTPLEDQQAVEPGNYGDLLPIGGFEIPFGPLATLRSSNLTSDIETGIGAMSDGELARIIRHGIREDGSPAFFMVVAPALTDEDLTAIISYMRTIPPVRNEVAPSTVSLLGKVLFNGPLKIFIAPPRRSWESPPTVPAADEPSVERGRYLAWGPASCVSCHSGQAADDPWSLVDPFGGCTGSHLDETDPSQEFCPPNLSPDPDFGWIRTWTEDAFVARLADGRRYAGTPMPWESYMHLTESDARSLYRYLQTVDPIAHDPGPPRRAKGWQASAPG